MLRSVLLLLFAVASRASSVDCEPGTSVTAGTCVLDPDPADYITVGGGYPQGPSKVGPADGLIDSPSVWFPVLVYLYYTGWVALIGFWSLWKLVAERGQPGQSTTLCDGELTLTAYKTTTFGQICFGVFHSYTPVFIVLYTMVIIDNYWDCQLNGPDCLCFRGSNPILGSDKYPKSLEYPPTVNQNIFFVMWCICMSWALFNFFWGSKMPNWFRAKCTFADATSVLCERKSKRVVMSNPNQWVRYSRKLLSFVGSNDRTHAANAAVVIAPSDGTRSFIFMCSQYTETTAKSDQLPNSSGVSAGDSVFVPAFVSLDLANSALKQHTGLSSEQRQQRLSLLGGNTIPFETDSWLSLFGNELCSYLYLYQLTFFLVWLWFSGLIWCSPQMIVVVVCAITSVLITHANQLKIKEIGQAGLGGTTKVNLDGKWVDVSSEELVPGDAIQLDGQSNWTLPCDAVITRGTCICDESGLTGESMPVRKSALPNADGGEYSAEKDEKHTLFAGTTLLQADSSGCTAVVTQTGIRTAKGDLVSMILYPAEMVFEYDEELAIVFTLLSIYAMILFAISIYLQWTISPMNWVSIFAFSCFTISQILPPLLPVALVIGHTKSASRLKERGVLCVQPKRIAISGKVHAFMFDKTGTLTQQGLSFIGVHRAHKSTWAGESQSYEPSKAKKGDLLTWSLATCHAVTHLSKSGGEIELVGNQVEVQMFTGSEWSLEENKGADVVVTSKLTGERLTIEQRFEFDHHTMTMSCLVRDEAGDLFVFCKGAPERVAALCDPSTVPEDFETISSDHAMAGCYVIGMSCCRLGKLSKADAAALTRSAVEKVGSLELLGLLLFRNELKHDTRAAIEMIKAGDVRPVMVTGDNAHCGYYIAKACNIIEAGMTVYLTDSKMPGGVVTWSDMDGGARGIGLSTSEVSRRADAANVELAVTGKAMAVLTQSGELDALLLKVRIFARVQPDQKVQVVSDYIDRGFITGMCGDGGNDCGALRTAHCGIALSDAEASVVSPFTSSTKSVQSVVDVLCEGRCALVTSFAAYRFYITYGLNWSIVKTVNFAYGVRMPITAYLTIDSICSWLCAWAITGACPLPELLNYRPTSSLFAGNTFLSVVVPWLVNMFLMGLMLLLLPTYDEHVQMKTELTKGVGWWELGDTWESTVFLFFQLFPLIWCGVVYSLGTKFRLSLYTNYPVILVWGALFFSHMIMLLVDANDVSSVFHIASNAHNGFNTESPVWMRYQLPLGCPDASSTAEYNVSVGLGSWRTELPSESTCAKVAKTLAKCGPDCLSHDAQPPSPGMPLHVRGTLLALVVVGMGFMMGWEFFINWYYIKEAKWEEESNTQEQANPIKNDDGIKMDEISSESSSVTLGGKEDAFTDESCPAQLPTMQSSQQMEAQSSNKDKDRALVI